MTNHYCFRNVDEALPVLCRDLLEKGEEVESRAGSTKELTFVNIELTHPMEREVLLPSRKASYPAQIAETMWVLAGRNDMGFLSKYLPRATEFSDDGLVWRAGYGARLRNAGVRINDDIYDPRFALESVDPLWNVVDLLRRDPKTRQAVIGIWSNNLDSGVKSLDIPCNNWLHFLARDGKLNLHVATRSNDLIWGWSGINQFEWSALLQLVAELTGLDVGSLHFSISSLHLYERHYEKASKIGADRPQPRKSRPVPFGVHSETTRAELAKSFDLWFKSEGESVQAGRAPGLLGVWQGVVQLSRGNDVCLEKGETFPPYAIQALNESPLKKGQQLGLVGGVTPLLYIQRPGEDRHAQSAFRSEVINLHAEKDAAYGNSWCKRGEMLSILPNIARKVDRLEGGAETGDETQLDTAIDLFVYTVKYDLWKAYDRKPGENLKLSEVENSLWKGELLGLGEHTSDQELVRHCVRQFEATIRLVEHDPTDPQARVFITALCGYAAQLAYTRWLAHQDDTPNTEAVNQ